MNLDSNSDREPLRRAVELKPIELLSILYHLMVAMVVTPLSVIHLLLFLTRDLFYCSRKGNAITHYRAVKHRASSHCQGSVSVARHPDTGGRLIPQNPVVSDVIQEGLEPTFVKYRTPSLKSPVHLQYWTYL